VQFILEVDPDGKGAFLQDFSGANIDLLGADRSFAEVDTFGLTLNDVFTYIGKNLTFADGGEWDLSEWLGSDVRGPRDRGVFAFAATEDLFLSGENVFEGGTDWNNNALIFAAGSQIMADPGTMIRYQDGHVVLLSSRMRLQDAIIESGYSLTVAALGTAANHVIDFSEVTLLSGVGQGINLYADTSITGQGLRFGMEAREIYVQSKTIVLGDVVFPDGSVVYLVSEFGPISGKYPNFGSVLPGRVNFMSNVFYGSFPITNRAEFDMFGKNIIIDAVDWFNLSGAALEAYKGYDQETRSALYNLRYPEYAKYLVERFLRRGEGRLQEVVRKGLTSDDVDRLLQYNQRLQDEILFNPNAAKILQAGLEAGQIAVLLNYPYETQARILRFSDSIPELFGFIETVGQTYVGLVDAVLSLAGQPGLDNSLLIEAGLFLNGLVMDRNVQDGDFSARVQTVATLLANPFNVEALKILGTVSGNNQLADGLVQFILEVDPGGRGTFIEDFSAANIDLLGADRSFAEVDTYGLTLNDIYTYIGKNLRLERGGDWDLSNWLGREVRGPEDRGVFAFAATEDLFLSGVNNFFSRAEWNNNALVFAAGSQIMLDPGSIIRYRDGHLVFVSSRMRLQDAVIESGYSLTLAALGTAANHVVDFKNVTLLSGVSQGIRVYADNLIEGYGLRFGMQAREIYMQSQTIVLGDVVFPDGSIVYLVSEFGPISGKYPNFGSVLPGRVNFMSGVYYGSRLISNRAQFDWYGQNIIIDAVDWFELSGEALEAYKGFDQETRSYLYRIGNPELARYLVETFKRSAPLVIRAAFQNGLNVAELEELSRYSSELRNVLLWRSDVAQLLSLNLNEVQMRFLVSQSNLRLSQFKRFGDAAGLAIEFYLDTYDFNESLVESVMNISGTPGINNAQLVEAGLFLNSILVDRILDGNDIAGRVRTVAELLSNSFTVEAISILGDMTDNGSIAHSMIGFLRAVDPSGVGRNLNDFSSANVDLLAADAVFDEVDTFGLTFSDIFTYLSNDLRLSGQQTINLSQWLGAAWRGEEQNTVFAIGALDDITVSGRIQFDGGTSYNNNALVFGAGSELILEPGSEIRYKDGHVVMVGSRMTLKQALIQSGYSISLAAFGAATNHILDLNDVTLLSGQNQGVNLYADSLLNARLLDFGWQARDIYMHAQTIVLGDVVFPDGSIVYLLSALGPIDGKYPNFGSILPGRVNFIYGVYYGNKLLNNRQQFDLFGQSVFIDAIGWFDLSGPALEAYKGFNQETRSRLYQLGNPTYAKVVVEAFLRETPSNLPLVEQTALSVENVEILATYPVELRRAVLKDSRSRRILDAQMGLFEAEYFLGQENSRQEQFLKFEKSVNAAIDFYIDIHPVNPDLVESVLNLAGDPGLDNGLLVEAGLFLNDLLADHRMRARSIFGNVRSVRELLSNPFNVEALSILGETTNNNEIADGLIAFLRSSDPSGLGQNLNDFSGANIDLLGADSAFLEVDTFGLDLSNIFSFVSNSLLIDGISEVDLSPWLGQRLRDQSANGVFAFGALEDITISGDVRFDSATDQNNNALVFGAGSEFVLEPGTRIRYHDGHVVVVASRISLQDAVMESGYSLSLASMGTTRDHSMHLHNVTLNAGIGQGINLYADTELLGSGLRFSSVTSEFYMQSQTVILADVVFPDGSTVYLLSTFGPLDGKYPNFGSIQPGRVNFLSGVYYGDDPLQTREDFDLFGQNILIDAIGWFQLKGDALEAYKGYEQSSRALLYNLQDIEFAKAVVGGVGRKEGALSYLLGEQFPTVNQMWNAMRAKGNQLLFEGYLQAGLHNPQDPLLVETGMFLNDILTTKYFTGAENISKMGSIYSAANILQNQSGRHILEMLGAAYDQEALAGRLIDALLQSDPSGRSLDLKDLNSDLIGARAFLDVGDFFGLSLGDVIGSAAKEVLFKSTEVSVPHLDDTSMPHNRNRVFALLAIEDMFFEGPVRFTADNEENNEAMALFALSKMHFDKGSSIDYDKGHLVLGGADTIQADQVAFRAANTFAMGTLEDMRLTHVHFKAKRVDLYANHSIDLQRVVFDGSVRDLYMEASTIALSGVNFSSRMDVTLASELGPIDGKYPNFHSIRLGRVNFVEDVSVDYMPVMDRLSFDQHGTNIQITTIQSPLPPGP
jgi:hypothetical protein